MGSSPLWVFLFHTLHNLTPLSWTGLLPSSSYCCNHYFSCLSRMGSRMYTPDNGPRLSVVSFASLDLYPSQMVGTLVRYLHTPLKLHLAKIIVTIVSSFAQFGSILRTLGLQRMTSGKFQFQMLMSWICILWPFCHCLSDWKKELKKTSLMRPVLLVWLSYIYLLNDCSRSWFSCTSEMMKNKSNGARRRVRRSAGIQRSSFLSCSMWHARYARRRLAGSRLTSPLVSLPMLPLCSPRNLTCFPLTPLS